MHREGGFKLDVFFLAVLVDCAALSSSALHCWAQPPVGRSCCAAVHSKPKISALLWWWLLLLAHILVHTTFFHNTNLINSSLHFGGASRGRKLQGIKCQNKTWGIKRELCVFLLSQ
ncbi:hypothetical protein VIGAN_07216000 [Vigna angularis var. angularis]|uniref:Uncharacterized protein n=1 Tax=Vigna angularis var. angularis TaxID=157739 RepID=A0A0S3SKC4_PHAAN|nr:hypothetical protein VIGAN_07216000 [Vigna angularis var. angularis]